MENSKYSVEQIDLCYSFFSDFLKSEADTFTDFMKAEYSKAGADPEHSPGNYKPSTGGLEITIRHEKMSELFDKYHIEGLPFPAVIHHFKGPEPHDAEPHDHPFDFTTFIMKGEYTERCFFPRKNEKTYVTDVVALEGHSRKVSATDVHLIPKMSEGGCFTLMLPGQKVREPGFWRFDPDGTAYFRQHDHSDYIKQ